MSLPERPLEPTAEEMRSLTKRVLDLLVETIEGLDCSPASLNTPSPGLLAAVSEPPPEMPENVDALLDLTRRAAEQSYQTAGPSYLAYIPGGGIFTSALAGFLAFGLNRYTGKATTAPALVAMEESVLRALFVRSRDALRRTFSEEADYMQDLSDTSMLPDFDALSPELTREFRGLRLWLPLHLHGVDAFRRQLDEKLDLAGRAYEALAADDRLEVPWVPDLSVIVFRLAGGDDAAQLRFLERINQSQRILLSSTRIEGAVYLRIAILSVRTHAERVREALEIISRAAGEMD